MNVNVICDFNQNKAQIKYYYSGGAAINESYGIFDYLDQVNMSQFHDETAQEYVSEICRHKIISLFQYTMTSSVQGNFDI